MSGAARWLKDRRDEAPGALADVMAAAVEATASEDVAKPTALGEAGIALLRKVASGEGGRDSALTLLAADALLTYAFECAAEAGPGALERVLGELAVERFEALLHEVEK